MIFRINFTLVTMMAVFTVVGLPAFSWPSLAACTSIQKLNKTRLNLLH